MLKYQPTRFWGMIRSKNNDENGMKTEDFAKFNQDLFYNPQIVNDHFVAVNDIDTVQLTVSEVQHVLQKHFKANKSTGLSLLPL
jgi:hypothetical protein